MLSVASGKSGISPGNLSAWSTFVSVTSLSFLLLLHLPEFFLVLVSRSPQARALPVAQRPPGPGLSQEGAGRALNGCKVHPPSGCPEPSAGWSFEWDYLQSLQFEIRPIINLCLWKLQNHLILITGIAIHISNITERY